MSITKIKYLLPPFFLTFLVLLVSLANYTPGTWLSGWDNLHPEFNFLLNIKRSLFAVWQEYQGLGLLGGMGHAADLLRQIFLWLLSVITPIQFMRYVYHFLMLIVGVLGVYKLVLYITREWKIGFLSSLLYLLNLGTAQIFNAPFEPFSTFWGFLPWEIWSLFKYLENPSRKNLLILMLVNFLAIPQSYVQTIFLIYLLCQVFIYSLHYLKHPGFQTLKNSLIVLVLILFINAFWLLPNLYFTLTHVSITQNAMNNKMNTDRFYEMNKKRGNLSDFIYLKGFNLDAQLESQVPGQQLYMMQPWRDHYDSMLIKSIGLGIFFFILIGLIGKNKYKPYFVGIYALSAIVFLNNVPVITTINDFIRLFPLMSQIIRNPFTKFITPLTVVYAVGFGLGLEFLLNYLHKKRIHNIDNLIFIVAVSVLIIYGLPMFQGKLISEKVRVEIPNYYFQLFDYFKSQDKNARIMNLPQDSYWGWGYHRWGSAGSGFLWYGIEQPIMDRAFDVWSSHLEQYYWELIYALRKKDQGLLNQVIKKYDISYIIFDDSYIPSDFNQEKWILKQKDLLSNNKLLSQQAQLGSVTIYKVNTTVEKNQNIYLSNNLSTTIKNESFSNKDLLYNNFGSYYEPNDKSNIDFIYPFESLFTNRFQKELNYNIEENNHQIVFSKKISSGKYLLNYPSISESSILIPINLYAKKELDSIKLLVDLKTPIILKNDKEFHKESIFSEYTIPLKSDSDSQVLLISINNIDFLTLPKLGYDYTFIGESFLLNNNDGNTISLYTSEHSYAENLYVDNFSDAEECTPFDGEKLNTREILNGEISVKSKNSSTCVPYKNMIPTLNQNSLYHVKLKYKSGYDELPKFCLFSTNLNQCLNLKDNTRLSFSENYIELNEYFENMTGLYDSKSFSLILEPNYVKSVNKIKQIFYKDISVTSYPLVFSYKIEPDFFNNIKNRQVELEDKSTFSLKVMLPKIRSFYSLDNVIKSNLYRRDAANYNTVIGDYYVKEKKVNDSKSLIFYSKDYVLNFLFEQKNILPDTGLLVITENRNISGFPATLKISTIKNSTNFVYTLLESNPKFMKNFYILPPIYPFDDGLQIQLTNTSLNNAPSVNEIKNISIYPIPYGFLSNLSLQKGAIPNSVLADKEFQAKKINLSEYLVQIDKNTDKKSMLILSQSYDSGWHAYQSQNFLLPFLFGQELKDHVLVNNWENGWRLDNETMKQSNSGTIVIIYLPQYLEYLGFILFGVAVLTVIFYPHNQQLPTIN